MKYRKAAAPAEPERITSALNSLMSSFSNILYFSLLVPYSIRNFSWKLFFASFRLDFPLILMPQSTENSAFPSWKKVTFAGFSVCWR